MNLNDVLLQQREIRNLLERLQVRHKRLLKSNEDDITSLNQVRKDILICLNDLKTLNGMLIDPGNGLLRKELENLDKYSKKLEDLKLKKSILRKDLNEWTDNSGGDWEDVDAWEPNSIVIKGNHRKTLDKYIDECGTRNLTFDGMNEDENIADLKDISSLSEPDRKKILNNINMLRLCKKQINSEIEQLKSLIKEYEKDKRLVEVELESAEKTVLNRVTLIQREESDVLDKQKKILKKLGIYKETESNSYFSFGNVSNSRERDFEIAFSQAPDFFEIKKNTLMELLRDSKKEASALVAQFNCWRDSITRIQALEISLQELFVARNGNISKDEVIAMIRNGLDHVAEFIDTNSEDDITSSLKSELESLKQAINELEAEQDNTSMNYHVNQPELLNLGTSPPKVQISTEKVIQQKRTSSGTVYKIDKAE